MNNTSAKNSESQPMPPKETPINTDITRLPKTNV